MNEEKRTEIWKWLVKSQHDLGSAHWLMESAAGFVQLGDPAGEGETVRTADSLLYAT